MAVDEEAVRARLLASLNAAKRDQLWPRVLEVRDAVDELGRWLTDDRQWSAQTRGRHWQSLIDDVVLSLDNLGVATSAELAVEDAKRELADCKGLFGGEKAPMDAALRRRLLLVVEGITSRAETADALTAAWADLERSAVTGEEDEPAARQLLSLATWHGHKPDSLVSGLTTHLTGPGVIWAAGTVHVPDPEDARSLEERFAAIRALVQTPPWRTVTIVWLRYQLARVDVPDVGLPIIEIGDAVRIFDGNWLRGCVSHPQNEHDLPPELLDESKWMLRSFCGVRAGDPPVIEQDPPESPTAYIRIVLEDEIVARAVDIARSNAEAIAAVGMLHGDAASEIWRLDDSHVAIAGDNEGGTSAPPSVEQPTASEREAVLKDTTSRVVREFAPQLAGHIPIRDPELERAATLMGWLRNARSAPAPLRLVLCDRVIESVCGWAGVQKPDAFVRDHLIPWWAYWRIRNVVGTAAVRLVWDHPFRTADDWNEIVNYSPLGIHLDQPRTINLRGFVAEIDWLLDRVPENSEHATRLTEVRDNTVTGQAAGRWWTIYCEHARRLELRRQRTRNALMHGGPLAPATVASVVEYAEIIAVDALQASLDGKLRSHSLIDHFLNRRKRVADMRAQLAGGEARAADVLFPEPW